MTMLDSPIQHRISILVYADLRRTYDYLTEVFGLGPGTLTMDADGGIVHGELHAGDGALWSFMKALD
jgi:MerR family transcriptional regulator, thiopeptide resistance regulator